MAFIERFRRNLELLLGVETEGSRAISSISEPGLELQQRYGLQLKRLVEEAERQKREVGVMICQSPDGVLHLSHPCWGERSTVTVRDCKGMIPAGSFHVHLRGVDVFSPPDLNEAILRERISCVGYMKDGVPMMTCITPRRFYEYPLLERLNMRGMLSSARVDLERLNRMVHTAPFTSLCSVPPDERARSVLTSIAQRLGAYEVAL
ncbi:MAG: hypothetical protein ACETV1_05315 [Candidatus Bathyarchaeia archaeon]